MTSLPYSVKYLIYILLGIASVFVLIQTRQLLVPLFLSILFAYLLYPTAYRMENFGIPRIVTNLTLILLTIGLIVGAVYFISVLIASFTDDLPDIKNQFEENVQYFQDALGNILGIGDDQFEGLVNGFGSATEYIVEIFTATTNTIVIIGLIPVYTFLLLLYRNKFKEFLSVLTPSHRQQTLNRIVEQAAEVVPKYLKGLIVVVLILMVINSTAFYLIGVEYALFFGVIAALFNFIPYLGTILGFLTVAILVLASQTPGLALGVIILFFPIQFTENNILTPNITGSYVNINPLIIIMSLFAASMIWGLPGMLLVIPYLAMFKIVCENVEFLEPIGYLIGTTGTEKYLPSLKGIRKKLGLLKEEPETAESAAGEDQ